MARYAMLIIFMAISTVANAQSCEKEATDLRSEYNMTTQSTRSTSIVLLWRNQAQVTLFCIDIARAITHFDVRYLPGASKEFITDSLATILKRFRPKDWQQTMQRVDACSKKLVLSDSAGVNPDSKAGVLCSRDEGINFSFYPAK
jgi:hypothetical protein